MNTKHTNVARAEYKRIAEHEWGSEHGWNRKHVEPKVPEPKVRRLYMAPAKAIKKADDLQITDKGAYIIEWGSMFRDMAALFLEGVGLVIFGHMIALSAVFMLVGIGLGLFGLRMKTKHVRRK